MIPLDPTERLQTYLQEDPRLGRFLTDGSELTLTNPDGSALIVTIGTDSNGNKVAVSATTQADYKPSVDWIQTPFADAGPVHENWSSTYSDYSYDGDEKCSDFSSSSMSEDDELTVIEKFKISNLERYTEIRFLGKEILGEIPPKNPASTIPIDIEQALPQLQSEECQKNIKLGLRSLKKQLANAKSLQNLPPLKECALLSIGQVCRLVTLSLLVNMWQLSTAKKDEILFKKIDAFFSKFSFTWGLEKQKPLVLISSLLKELNDILELPPSQYTEITTIAKALDYMARNFNLHSTLILSPLKYYDEDDQKLRKELNQGLIVAYIASLQSQVFHCYFPLYKFSLSELQNLRTELEGEDKPKINGTAIERLDWSIKITSYIRTLIAKQSLLRDTRDLANQMGIQRFISTEMAQEFAFGCKAHSEAIGMQLNKFSRYLSLVKGVHLSFKVKTDNLLDCEDWKTHKREELKIRKHALITYFKTILTALRLEEKKYEPLSIAQDPVESNALKSVFFQWLIAYVNNEQSKKFLHGKPIWFKDLCKKFQESSRMGDLVEIFRNKEKECCDGTVLTSAEHVEVFLKVALETLYSPIDEETYYLELEDATTSFSYKSVSPKAFIQDLKITFINKYNKTILRFFNLNENDQLMAFVEPTRQHVDSIRFDKEIVLRELYENIINFCEKTQGRLNSLRNYQSLFTFALPSIPNQIPKGSEALVWDDDRSLTLSKKTSKERRADVKGKSAADAVDVESPEAPASSADTASSGDDTGAEVISAPTTEAAETPGSPDENPSSSNNFLLEHLQELLTVGASRTLERKIFKGDSHIAITFGKRSWEKIISLVQRGKLSEIPTYLQWNIRQNHLACEGKVTCDFLDLDPRMRPKISHDILPMLEACELPITPEIIDTHDAGIWWRYSAECEQRNKGQPLLFLDIICQARDNTREIRLKWKKWLPDFKRVLRDLQGRFWRNAIDSHRALETSMLHIAELEATELPSRLDTAEYDEEQKSLSRLMQKLKNREVLSEDRSIESMIGHLRSLRTAIGEIRRDRTSTAFANDLCLTLTATQYMAVCANLALYRKKIKNGEALSIPFKESRNFEKHIADLGLNEEVARLLRAFDLGHATAYPDWTCVQKEGNIHEKHQLLMNAYAMSEGLETPGGPVDAAHLNQDAETAIQEAVRLAKLLTDLILDES